MAIPSAGATAGIAAGAYSIGGAIANNMVWHYATQAPPIAVPDTISNSWVLLIGASLQAAGHGIHWCVNRRKVATAGAITATPAAPAR